MFQSPSDISTDKEVETNDDTDWDVANIEYMCVNIEEGCNCKMDLMENNNGMEVIDVLYIQLNTKLPLLLPRLKMPRPSLTHQISEFSVSVAIFSNQKENLKSKSKTESET